MAITTDTIKLLRDETGVSIMQCKKALEEAGGDMEKAKIILRKSSAAIATKKGDRTLGAGTVAAYTHAGGTVVGAVVLACETDFVSRNEEFGKLAYDIAMHVAAMSPQFKTREDVQESDLRAAREVFAKEVESLPEASREMALTASWSRLRKKRRFSNNRLSKTETSPLSSSSNPQSRNSVRRWKLSALSVSR